jgi:hypothetical protein
MMKAGKYIRLGEYENIKLGFGTVDFRNLKTIYIKLNSWLLPINDEEDFDLIISTTRRLIKDIIYKKSNNLFRPQSIVDLDIKSKGIKTDKKSFMNLEITLYTINHFDIKDITIKEYIKNLSIDIIEGALIDKNLFNFNKTKN